MDDCEDCMPALLIARIASAGNRPERWRAETTAGLIQRWRVGQVEILRAAGILFLGVSLIPPVVASTLVNGRGNDVWRTTPPVGIRHVRHPSPGTFSSRGYRQEFQTRADA